MEKTSVQNCLKLLDTYTINTVFCINIIINQYLAKHVYLELSFQVNFSHCCYQIQMSVLLHLDVNANYYEGSVEE